MSKSKSRKPKSPPAHCTYLTYCKTPAHQAILRRLRSNEATIVREPHNPHDRHACAVHVRGGMVGYVPAEIAAEIAPIIDADPRWTYVISSIRPRIYEGFIYAELTINPQLRKGLIRWECPACRDVLEVPIGAEPALCPVCQQQGQPQKPTWETVQWRCPGCQRVVTIPVNADPVLCSECDPLPVAQAPLPEHLRTITQIDPEWIQAVSILALACLFCLILWFLF